MKFVKYFLPIFFLFLFFTKEVFSQQIIFPEINSRVTDNGNILSENEINQLTEKLDKFYKNTSVDFIVVIIKSLEGIEVRDYGVGLLEKIKPGKKDKDNGILLLVAVEDRKVSIEVGYGLEGDLTDASSSSIIRNFITPNFKNGNYYEGINDAIDEIQNHFQIEPGSKKEKNISIPIWLIIPIFIFLFIFLNKIKNQSYYIGSHRRGTRYPTYFGGFGGGFSGSRGGWSGGGGSFGGGGASGSW